MLMEKTEATLAGLAGLLCVTFCTKHLSDLLQRSNSVRQMHLNGLSAHDI